MPMSAVALRTLHDLERLSRSGLDSRAFRHAALRKIDRVVPVDAAWFATTDPTTLLFTSAVVDDVLRSEASLFVRNEFLEEDVNQFRDLATSGRIVGSLDVETSGRRERSPRYRDILERLALGDELRVALVDGGHCWGFMCLHRGRGAGFAPKELSFMRRAAAHLATGLRTGLLLESLQPGPEPNAPGLLVLTRDLSLVTTNAAAELLLAEVADDSWTGRTELPSAVYGVAGALLAQDGEKRLSSASQPKARLQTAAGRWLTLQATWLVSPGAEQERQIAVLLETSPSIEIWPLLAAAHQLTEREREVTLLVARGRSTTEIAHALRIGENTVQDYLKAVFDKFGVHSRGQLVAAIFGSHYLPLMH